jgi:hypothetical protein
MRPHVPGHCRSKCQAAQLQQQQFLGMAAAGAAALMVGAMQMCFLKQYKKQTHYGVPCVEGGYRRATGACAALWLGIAAAC